MSPSHIRNFAIIAHIDSGKTTLTDRLLQATHTVSTHDFHDRFLDANPIEQERGVTIKLAPVTMNYKLSAISYMLNLIDTPGHVDFSYEVDRSLAACEGALLLIDGTRGIQAQTLSHAHKAANLGLHLIPVINKIDLASTDVSQCLRQLNDIFGFKANEVSLISAKTGQGIDSLLSRIISDIPTPSGKPDPPLRALIFNSVYDDHLGVIAFVRIVDGSINNSLVLTTFQNHLYFTPKEIGIFTPYRQSILSLSNGQVGYLATGLKDIHRLHIGDTLIEQPKTNDQRLTAKSLPGYHPPQPVVFVDAFPTDDNTYTQLVDAVDKLRLSDSSLTVKSIHSSALGPGLRLGFLGLFHIDITRERLDREHKISLLLTTPTVEYQIILTSGQTITVTNPNQLPDPSLIKLITEPWVKINLITPPKHIGPVMQILESHRGVYVTTNYFGTQAQLIYQLPLVELIRQLADHIKSVSQGFASFDYQSIDPQPVDLVKLEIFVHHQPVEPLTRLIVKDQASHLAHLLVETIKRLIPPQQFAIPIQALIGGQVIARETKSALRKDVTQKLYGGDQTRKDKLLKKQKKGKKLLAQTSRVYLPSRVLIQLATT